MGRGLIYLDYAATTPVDDSVLEAMKPYFCEIFANPSSKHKCGRSAEKAVAESREILASAIGASSPSEIIFTSGASESNNLAIKGYAELFDEPRHFITTSFEHKAALQAFENLGEWGHRISLVSPGRSGVVDPAEFEALIEPDTALVSCMLVNNEVGTIQPIDDIADMCKSRGIAFHCDATQAFGKMPVSCGSNIDFISISAHKFYGPKGIGALYARNGSEIKCQISGGSQENGHRSGTLNVPGIVGMAKATEVGIERMGSEWDRLSRLSDIFLDRIKSGIPMHYIQGDLAKKVPWINNICFAGVDSGKARDELGAREICVSRTSACSKSGGKSHVLDAMGTIEEFSEGALRFSFGSRTTEMKVMTAAAEVKHVITELRSR
jgi:cysteine desulfurase